MPQLFIKDIIRQLRELQEGSMWFDQSFKDKIEGLTEAEAFSNPLPAIHSVAEQLSHILAWRDECLLRFKGERTDLMNSPEDWRNNTELRKIGWNALKKQFYTSTITLIDALKDQDDAYLDIRFQDTDYNFHYIIEGIIQHDLYHLGQIGVTIKLLKQSESFSNHGTT